METCSGFEEVDLAPTLALLLGIPIPKNSVGALLPDLFDTFTEEQQLRALEVNAWQIMRLLSVRSPKSQCLRNICSGQETTESFSDKNDNGDILKLCNLYTVAKRLHSRWQNPTCNKEDHNCFLIKWETVSVSYQTFLWEASSWLSRGTTEKNRFLVSSGVVLMFISAVIFIGVSLWVNKEISRISKSQQEFPRSKLLSWIALFGVCGHALSFNSSSFVEEEQFTMHFLVVSLWWFFLRETCQQRVIFNPAEFYRNITSYGNQLFNLECKDKEIFLGKEIQRKVPSTLDRKKQATEIASVTVVLITARLIRGWHRGGVNWTHLPDGAKWMEQADRSILLAAELFFLAAGFIICCWLVLEQRPKNLLQRIATGSLISAFVLILCYKLRTKDGAVVLVDQFSIKLAQFVYVVLGGTVVLVALVTPWFISSRSTIEKSSPIWECQLCLNFIGKVLISCWYLLHLLLQQPVNSVPLFLLLVQLVFCFFFFRVADHRCSVWLKILTLYWMGASGHFGMGNTNTLATVDVAGAYIGLSEHSTFLSGVLAFTITYAAPLLYMFGIPLMVSTIDTTNNDIDETKAQVQHWLLVAVALPWSVLLALSSVILVVFTVVMLFMQGHLFIWSVFSPKYIYVCFTILSTYVGVLVNTFLSLYTFIVVGKNKR